MIDLIVRPREKITWEEFLEMPSYAIGLDGVVTGGPNFNYSSRHINFDHHDNVFREATMSTCKQVYMAIKGGLFQLFQIRGEPRADVYINDPDQDTALAVYLLKNHEKVRKKQNYKLNRLIELTDKLDITGGTFSLNTKNKLLMQHNWIFTPYVHARTSGSLATADEQVMKKIVENIEERINKFLEGNGGTEPLDIRHEILYESNHGYNIINEIGGNDARYYLVSKGMNAFISKVSDDGNGKTVWTIGKRSRYIPFPVKELYKLFNEAEGLTDEEGWGGSDIVGGSSREHGSKLTAQDLARITDEYLDSKTL